MKTSYKENTAAKSPAIQSITFDSLPDSTFVRQADLVRNPKRPELIPLLPFSAPTLWRKVKEGSFPKPTMLGPKITAWRVGQVKEWLAAQSAS